MPLGQSFQNHQGLFVSRPILSPYPDSSIINLLPYALDLDSNHFKMTCSVGLQDTLSRHSEQTAIHSLYLCLTILKYINKTEKERRAARAHRIHRRLSFIWLLCKIAVQYIFLSMVYSKSFSLCQYERKAIKVFQWV